MNYKDTVLLRLRRIYSKEESVKFALDELQKARIEIGMLKSEIAELQDENEALEKKIETVKNDHAFMGKANQKKMMKLAEEAKEVAFWREKYLSLKNR
jgi:hypothetical protein